MRLSETITIYLAAGAPFAVSHFLHAVAREHLASRVLKAVGLGLLWPLTALRILFAASAQPESYVNPNRVSQPAEERVQIATRKVLASIRALSELTASAEGTMNEEIERPLCVLLDSVETYVGLAPIVAESERGAVSDEQAMELFQITGRQGIDLALATKCVHRRNVRRIIEHCARARNQLVHAITDIHEAIDHMRTSTFLEAAMERRLGLATVDVYKNIVALLLLMKDQETALQIAEQLNHELSRMRRLGHAETRRIHAQEIGEKPCKGNISNSGQAPLPNESTMIQS